MSFIASYIAVKGISKSDLYVELGLQKEDKSAIYFFDGVGDLLGAALITGWYLVIDRTWSLIKNEALLTRLSMKAKVNIGALNERTNYSLCACWENGSRLWFLEHNAERGNNDLTSSGILPSEFETIKKRVVERSQEEGFGDLYFDIPLRLFEDLTGFEYMQQDEIFVENSAECLKIFT